MRKPKGRNENQREKYSGRELILSVLFALLLTACGGAQPESSETTVSSAQEETTQAENYDSVQDVPEYSGEPYVEINDNQPEFEEQELVTVSYEEYSELDELGRCGEAEACIGEDLMPTEEREPISQVEPTGWENKAYYNVDGKYLYNRCHLIGYQLSGENANEENLITGTRYMNTEGMLPFENMVADYVHKTENHVMYRVTPVFQGDDLVASGVQMEAESVEDDGKGICFNVYVYNVQPEITINYSTGDNWFSGPGDEAKSSESGNQPAEEQTYILNTNTRRFHNPDCSGAKDIKEKNREEYTGTREELLSEGYEPCGRCKP